MNNSCKNSMIVRHNSINDEGIRNTVTLHSGDATNDKGIRDTLTLNSGDAIHEIPDTITIFPSDLEDASTEFSVHASLVDSVNVNKLSRYIFPREDPGL